MNTKQWSALGLKWNPFSEDVPLEAILVTPKAEHFCWRVENQLREGGFSLITGDVGTGKSVTMRVLEGRLGRLRDVSVGCITRPGSRLADFYRELGEIFGVPMAATNRWGGFKALREKWMAHTEATLMRPVLLIDEAQEMVPETLSELRLLSAYHFDSRAILTIVLAGDTRLTDLFRSKELLPLGSRMRVRMVHECATRDQLMAGLTHRLAQAGNAQLMTPELITALCEHALGNFRVLLTMANELLDAAIAKDLHQIDEKLYLEVYAPPVPRKPVPQPAKAVRR
jgi:type II secretory pathway predicted ATPase ExeA